MSIVIEKGVYNGGKKRYNVYYMTKDLRVWTVKNEKND